MRTLNWIVSATLLVSLSAAAQQPADSQTSQPATTMSAPGAIPDQTAQPAQPAPATTQAAPANAQPAPPQAAPQPTTMDQVVDRFVMREKGLIKMLQTRTPVI